MPHDPRPNPSQACDTLRQDPLAPATKDRYRPMSNTYGHGDGEKTDSSDRLQLLTRRRVSSGSLAGAPASRSSA